METTHAGLIDALSREFKSARLVFGHGTNNAWDEATALVLGVTGAADDRASLHLPVGVADVEKIEALARRRVEERIPLAYLLERARFAGIDFIIEAGVVIPRSPIGALIIQGMQPWIVRPPESVLDLCCGSGCIGIAAAVHFPEACVTLVDNDPVAVDLAKRNIALHRLEERVSVIRADLYAGLNKDASFDLILSNPPYVDGVDMSSLPEEYRHEPETGLAGGADGLDIVHRIIEGRHGFLSVDGSLVCEVGNSSAALLRAYPDLPFIWPGLSGGGEGVFILQAH